MMLQLMIVVAVSVFVGLPSLLVICSCVAGTDSDYLPLAKSSKPSRVSQAQLQLEKLATSQKEMAC